MLLVSQKLLQHRQAGKLALIAQQKRQMWARQTRGGCCKSSEIPLFVIWLEEAVCFVQHHVRQHVFVIPGCLEGRFDLLQANLFVGLRSPINGELVAVLLDNLARIPDLVEPESG